MQRKKTTEPIETPNLEMLVMQCPYQVRDASLAELRAGLERILHPRQTNSYGGVAHFLSVPEAPRVERDRGGLPRRADEKALSQFQEQLAEVTRRERELNDLAQKARNVASTLYEWAVALGIEEDRLLLSVLTEDDRPTVLAYVAAHNRFIRTCQSWADRLVF